MTAHLRRAYDPPEDGGGPRVLVDRLWPRGIRKEDAAIDDWPKAVTPSDELRRWFHGPDGQWEEFVRRYEAEPAGPEAAAELARLRALSVRGPLTLVTAVKDPTRSHASVRASHLAPGDAC